MNAAVQGMVEDAAGEDHQGMHGLVPGGGRDGSIPPQVGQERRERGFVREGSA